MSTTDLNAYRELKRALGARGWKIDAFNRVDPNGPHIYVVDVDTGFMQHVHATDLAEH